MKYKTLWLSLNFAILYHSNLHKSSIDFDVNHGHRSNPVKVCLHSDIAMTSPVVLFPCWYTRHWTKFYNTSPLFLSFFPQNYIFFVSYVCSVKMITSFNHINIFQRAFRTYVFPECITMLFSQKRFLSLKQALRQTCILKSLQRLGRLDSSHWNT